MTDELLIAVEVAQVSLRADPSVLPFAAPEPNTTAIWNSRDVLWLGPNEWLVLGEPGSEESIQRDLAGAMEGNHHSVIDVSANRIVFDLTDGVDLLASGCGLDLDPSRWLPGMCAQSVFGGAQVILHQFDERTTRVLVRPSFAGYFVDRLTLTRHLI